MNWLRKISRKIFQKLTFSKLIRNLNLSNLYFKIKKIFNKINIYCLKLNYLSNKYICNVNEDHDNWDEILVEVVFAYNNSEDSLMIGN